MRGLFRWKSASQWDPSSKTELGLKMRPLSLVPFKYLTMTFSAVAWDSFGLWVNRATWLTANAICHLSLKPVVYMNISQCDHLIWQSFHENWIKLQSSKWLIICTYFNSIPIHRVMNKSKNIHEINSMLMHAVDCGASRLDGLV